jgi:hypothetical protein
MGRWRGKGPGPLSWLEPLQPRPGGETCCCLSISKWNCTPRLGSGGKGFLASWLHKPRTEFDGTLHSSNATNYHCSCQELAYFAWINVYPYATWLFLGNFPETLNAFLNNIISECVDLLGRGSVELLTLSFLRSHPRVFEKLWDVWTVFCLLFN